MLFGVLVAVFDAAAASAASSEQGTARRLCGQSGAAALVALDAWRCGGAIGCVTAGLLRAARSKGKAARAGQLAS